MDSQQTNQSPSDSVNSVPQQQAGASSGISTPYTGRHKTRAERVAAHVSYYGIVQKISVALKDKESRHQILLVTATTLAMCCLTSAWNPPLSYNEFDIPERDVVSRVPFVVSEHSAITKQPSQVNQYHVKYQQPNNEQPEDKQRVTEGLPTRNTFPPDKTVMAEATPSVIGSNNVTDKNTPTLKNENSNTGNSAPEGVRTTDESEVSSPSTNLFTPSHVVVPLGLSDTTQQGIAQELVSNSQPPTNKIAIPVLQDHSQSPLLPSNVDLLDDDPLIGETTNLTNGQTPELAVPFSTAPLSHPIAIPDNQSGNLFAVSNDIEIHRFEPGVVLVRAGEEITRREKKILIAEHLVILQQRTIWQKLSRFCGAFFLTLALFLLAYVFLHRRERRKPKTTLGMLYFYLLMVLTVIVARFIHGLSQNGANLELVVILLLAQCIAIAFSWELALVATIIVTFVVTLAQTNTIFDMILVVGITASMVVHLGRLRSRTKLMTVGLFGAFVAFFLTLFVKMVESETITRMVFIQAFINSVWTCASAILMTSTLPFIERTFGILTDMSLLDLGDPSHPLLRELIRRAPATYSHSVQVASIAETAAEAIGARGLLVRVGAYFHDIGKMLNPDFFTENQVPGHNVHDTLEPRMSTLVIVSHIKDGADLARQHRVPQPIIDLIEQHHGTSLVSFFHALAVKQNRDHGYTTQIDEGSFRYPGPKPQSKEGGLLMLADAAESACRSLREMSPNKIEAMVRQVSENKLKDGQFDDSGLTLKELRIAENSIITSILATRHNRISYPTSSASP